MVRERGNVASMVFASFTLTMWARSRMCWNIRRGLSDLHRQFDLEAGTHGITIRGVNQSTRGFHY